jgi:CRISPR/Cas system CMR-associated protein Cmr3 (group 5 of RAMP superfamily)
MNSKSEPWYIHAALYAVIVILIAILVKVAIIDPKNIVEEENYFKKEARLRMKDIKEAEILYQKKYNRFSGNLDTLINFIKTDKMVDSVMNGFDSLSRRSSNPFVKLSDGKFTPDSLFRTPKSQQRFTLKIDSSITADTVVDRRGKILRIDKSKVFGTKYYLEDPDGFGTIGSLDNDALKNTASWE